MAQVRGRDGARWYHPALRTARCARRPSTHDVSPDNGAHMLPLRAIQRLDTSARMRLNSIKLSGFKSFAEPTTFQLPGQLVGVVGPNGCGKSNIMDAVRWVLGESKASELRGESMQDVIFNGSGHAQAGQPRQRRAGVRQRRRARRRPVEPVRRDRRQARADARRHHQLLHQQPAGAPARRAGRLPRHRPRPARLRDHRPGHDQPHHREQARGAAPVPRGGRRRLASTRNAAARPRTG